MIELCYKNTDFTLIYNDCSHLSNDFFSFHAGNFGVGAGLTFSIAAHFISRLALA